MQFETFPATLMDAKTNEFLMDMHYEVFHLLAMYPLKKLRTRDADGNVISVAAPLPMFRLEKYMSRIIIHDQLKRQFDDAKITGFQYRPFK